MSPHKKFDSKSSFFPVSASDVRLLPLAPSSSIEEMDPSPTPALSEHEQTSHHRVNSARLDTSLNPLFSLLEQDDHATLEILDGAGKIPLMLPQPLGQTFHAAYAKANTLEQKIKVIVQAIEHFYLHTPPTLKDAAVRFITTHPRWELQQWIQRLDELFIANKQNPPAQLKLVNAATVCWTALQTSFTREKTDEKSSPISYDSNEGKLSPISTNSPEKNTHFFSETSESKKNQSYHAFTTGQFGHSRT